MIVVIDPQLKKLFFDRVMEMNGNSPYQATKWIESVAYGEKVTIANKDIDYYVSKINELEKLVEGYRRDYIRENKFRRSLSVKMRGIDEEVESYLEEIEGYRAVLSNVGLGEYL